MSLSKRLATQHDEYKQALEELEADLEAVESELRECEYSLTNKTGEAVALAYSLSADGPAQERLLADMRDLEALKNALVVERKRLILERRSLNVQLQKVGSQMLEVLRAKHPSIQ